jgi:hypothetical protein
LPKNIKIISIKIDGIQRLKEGEWIANNHISEKSLDNRKELIDEIIENKGSLEELNIKAKDFLCKVLTDYDSKEVI